MAEALAKDAKQIDNKEKGEGVPLECAVCLQTCVHPAQLPCGHIFCFLCVKGIANQSKKCAMCRQEIPRDFIDQPTLLHTDLEPSSEGFDGGYQWFYEGRNGWWQYDERTSKELEIAYKAGDRTCELLIAGFLYIVDLENMVQLRRNDPSRRRQIKRDFATVPKKGIAGLRTGDNQHQQNTRNLQEGRPDSLVDGRTDNLVPITPSNTPQSPTSGRESPTQEQNLQATVERISSLQLDSESYNLRNNQSNERDDDTRSRGNSFSRHSYFRHRSRD